MKIENLDILKKFSISKDDWDDINLDKAKEFIQAFETKDSFLYLFENYDFKDEFSDITVENFGEKFSENEFKQFTFFHAQRLFDILGKEFIFKGSNENSWIFLNINFVKNGFIKSEYLVNFKSKDGRFNISDAINSENKETIKETLNAIARNLYGATKLRGWKGIQSCPMATAYFMAYLSNDIAENIEIAPNEIFEFFRSNKSIFDEFIMRMNSKLTVIAEKSVRNAIISYCISNDIKETEFKNLVKRLGIESSWRLLGSLKEKDILDIMKEF